mgnify:CR=1 FL=1
MSNKTQTTLTQQEILQAATMADIENIAKSLTNQVMKFYTITELT